MVLLSTMVITGPLFSLADTLSGLVPGTSVAKVPSNANP